MYAFPSGECSISCPKSTQCGAPNLTRELACAVSAKRLSRLSVALRQSWEQRARHRSAAASKVGRLAAVDFRRRNGQSFLKLQDETRKRNCITVSSGHSCVPQQKMSALSCDHCLVEWMVTSCQVSPLSVLWRKSTTGPWMHQFPQFGPGFGPT